MIGVFPPERRTPRSRKTARFARDMLPVGSRKAAPSGLSHPGTHGHAHMIDVGHKPKTARAAKARALVRMLPSTLARLTSGDTPKGDVLAVVRVAAIQAAKRTSDWIPLCHPLGLTRIAIDIALGKKDTVTIEATVETTDRTGVEMEAMVAASAGALTLYDMLKGIDRAITFHVALVFKRGGKSGYVAP